LEISRSGGSARNGSSLASGPISFSLVLEIEEIAGGLAATTHYDGWK
jgi:hypothetical protein